MIPLSIKGPFFYFDLKKRQKIEKKDTFVKII
jgi:hypothetical protein